MEVWIHPSLRINALGLTPSSRIQLPGQFQSSLSPTLGGCFITFYTAWHILRWDMQNPLVKTDCPIDTFSATISLGYTPLRYLTVSLTESRLLFRIALPNALTLELILRAAVPSMGIEPIKPWVWIKYLCQFGYKGKKNGGCLTTSSLLYWM